MKLARKYLLPILLAICCALFSAAFFAFSAKPAKADESIFTLAGASVRFVSSAGDDQGIRFEATADKAEFNTLAAGNTNLIVKVIIASLPNLNNAGIAPEGFDIDSSVFKHEIYIYQKTGGNVTMNRMMEDPDDSSRLKTNVYIWKIPEDKYQMFWVAKMYYEGSSCGSGYSDNLINQSMSEVARITDKSTPDTRLEQYYNQSYTVQWVGENGSTVLKTDSNQVYGTAFSAPSVSSRTGYNQVWYKRIGTSGGNPIWSSTAFDISGEDGIVKGNTQLKLGYELINYTITYDGLTTAPGGAETTTNPTTYNVETATITISDPTETNNKFLGWTYEGQTTPVKNPTIPVGSTGNKTFTANWADFTVEDDFVYMGYYGLIEPTSVSGYGITTSDVTYTSANRSIATVTGHKITPVSAGNATITANIGNLQKTFTVTVKATSEGDGEPTARAMTVDYGTASSPYQRHNNNTIAFSVFNYSDNPTLFMGDGFMDERDYFTDFYTSRYTTSNAYLVGINDSRASHWRFFVRIIFPVLPQT